MKRANLILVILLAIAPAHAATEIDGRPNNPYGVQLGIGGRDFSDYFTICAQWASELSGDWGHVRIGAGVDHDSAQETIRALAMCRAHHLIPIFTGLYVPEEYRIPGGGDAAPYIRTDGYPLAAAKYRAWAKALADVGALPPYREVGNEINGKWEPEAYGRFIIAISQALKSELPDLKVVSAGLAGNGAEFLGPMLDAVPEAKNHIDCWGLHPYGANHPPSYEKDGYCLRGHQWTEQTLKEKGVANPIFIMTESGYELGNKKDTDYPRITDELRAKYMVEAYKTVWEPAPGVGALTIFILHGTVYPGWDGWVMVRTDCTKTETFKALAAVPKPKGSDWMPQGSGIIAGRVTDSASKQPVERTYAYTLPGVYAAMTDDAGDYRIENVPDGDYTVHFFRDGFSAEPPVKVQVSANKTITRDSVLTRVGLIPPDLGGKGKVASGWQPMESVTDASFHPEMEASDANYAVDSQVRHSGTGSQRIKAAGGKSLGIWKCSDYCTAVPDRPYAAEIWVRGKGLKRGKGEGVKFSLSITDPFARIYTTSSIVLDKEGDFDWTPLSVSIAPYPVGRRLLLRCEVDAEAGTVWFDDAYLHYAEYPVPSRSSIPESGSAVIAGEVVAEKEERMAGGMVCLWPGNIWTETRSDGTYTIENVPAGTYDVWAYCFGKSPGVVRNVKLGEGATVETLLTVQNPPAPRELQNAGFEVEGAEEAAVPGWMRFGEFDGFAASGWHKDIPDLNGGMKARSGKSFAGSIAGSNVKNGGIYQIVEVDPGKYYRAGVWSYTWQTGDGQEGDVANRLGLDPTGGRDPNGPYVIWTPFRPSHEKWTHVTLDARALENRMTFFLESKQILGLTFNLNVFDDATFEQIPEAEFKQ